MNLLHRSTRPKAVAALAACLLATLGGCASSDGLAPRARMIETSDVGLSSTAASSAPGADWWRAFGDPALNNLIERALADNPSLKVAQARFARAQAMVSGVRSADGVQVSAAVDVSREHFSANSIYPAPLGGANWTLGTAQLGASWEFDFFGRNRAAIDAALGAQRAAQADAQAAGILLASQVARSYVQLGRSLEQRALLERTLAQREETLALIQQRVQAGLDTAIELRQGEGTLPDARQQIEQLDEQLMLTRHTLAALTAQAPVALDGLVASLGEWQGAA
ncbi:MAG: TolC family protein, partial [Betaproteobacteria bacterium]